VVVADLDLPMETVDEIESIGAQAYPVEVDVADRASTEAMAASALDRFGRIDVLVNNAAFYMAVTKSRFEDITVDEWELCFAVNVRGPWLCARAVSPTMRRQGSGKIVNIASMTVEDGTPDFLHYVASKSAIIGLTRSLARELGDDGIAVNTITPDYIPHDKDYAAEQWDGLNAWIEGDRCFKREQVPEDMVGTLLYLASSQSDFVSGQNIRVNGGRRFA
jgi:3-oxoacyl-[acyl-carrier protein] reductase